MAKINKRLEIVRSTTNGLSSMSQESCDAILAVLDKHFAYVGDSIVNNLSDLESLVALAPDLVFLGMKFVPANQDLGRQHAPWIWLPEYLNERGIAYTGSNRAAHELAVNKPSAKQRALDAGLKTAPFWVAPQAGTLNRANMALPYPLFVKPTDRGGGLGIDTNSVVRNFYELQSKVQSITDSLGSDSLIEEYLPGREFSVAILKDDRSGEHLAMPIELIAPLDVRGTRLLSNVVKSSNEELAIAVTDKALRSRVSVLALNVFAALGARDYGRIDIRLDQQGSPHFLEANLTPNLVSGYGSFPKACALNLGLEFESMIIKIAKLGLSRGVNNLKSLPRSMAINNPVFPVNALELKPS